MGFHCSRKNERREGGKEGRREGGKKGWLCRLYTFLLMKDESKKSGRKRVGRKKWIKK